MYDNVFAIENAVFFNLINPHRLFAIENFIYSALIKHVNAHDSFRLPPINCEQSKLICLAS